MTLDTSGALLEGIRVSTGNASFTYPPRNIIIDNTAFATVQNRSEYLFVASHPTAFGTDIGDPLLSFFWSRNDKNVVRFDFDNFGRRWAIAPGGPPDMLGVLGNSPRLKFQVPDSSIISAPYDIWLGFPTRIITFRAQFVKNSSFFGSPSPGIVEISQDTGELNFRTSDLSNPSYNGGMVYGTRQNFFDRTKTNGSIGAFPISVSTPYNLFLNPRPASGQKPQVRIGFRSCLQPIEVPTESNFTPPLPGTFQWSANTGKLNFSPIDVASYLGSTVYYDGVYIASFQLARFDLGTAVASWPLPAYTNSLFAGVSDANKFCIFSNSGGVRSYFQVTIFDSSISIPTGPSDGTIYLDKFTGNVFLSSSDLVHFGSSISCVNTVVPIENGIAVQFFRSGVNRSGVGSVSDFTIKYSVTKQIITDNILQAPFVMLPTIPLVDSSLAFSVDSGTGSTGSFTGSLVDANDSTKFGYGYFLDLDHKKITYSNRKNSIITLDRDNSLIKLSDSMVFASGFTASRNGSSIRPGIDFDFNATAGLLEFITPMGENDPGNILNIPGVFSTHSFVTPNQTFIPSHAGSYILVSSGANSGIYKIQSVPNPHMVTVSETFSFVGTGTVDLRVNPEIVADRFWQDFTPPYKKFSIIKTSGTSSSPLSVLDFSVLPSTGQVNLNNPAQYGDIFQVSYISLDSLDGVSITPTAHTEFASFKIRQEVASVQPRSAVVQINPSSKTVDISRPIKVYIDGVTQDSSSFVFTSPGTITLGSPITTELVTVDYWIHEATGGETNFNLLFSPVDLDGPSIIAGQNTTTFNGDQTSLVQAGGAFLVDGQEVFIVGNVSYDLASDKTTVTFEETPGVSTNTNAKFQVTLPINGSYRIRETATVDSFPKNTNFFTISGKVSYVADMVITVHGDPYRISAVKYDATKNKTSILTATPAKYNYIIPQITHTIRPILSPQSSFQTNGPAHTGYPFTLVVGGNNHQILKNKIDYLVGEGGSITLKNQVFSGNVLYALYVARVSQPAGTVFNLNYAYGISPDDSNGIRGQRLNCSYNLSAPDSFFCRVETIQSFIPEVIDELQKSALSGGPSGPNISSVRTLKNKDFGISSPYFDEQHLGNLDTTVSRLLRFYNDLANNYEDILASLDGRVVGGQSGRFRFDGILNNPPRSSYSSITNDIDDSIALYQSVSATGTQTFTETPVFGIMWQNNNFSRFYPTLRNASVALNDKIGSSNYGKILGSFNISNITSAGVMTSSRAASVFSADRTGGQLTISQNGDFSKFLPAFAVGQKVKIYDFSGLLDVSSTITSVSGTGPYVISISTPTTLPFGSIVQDTSDPSITSNHFYTPGRDIGLNQDNGQIKNITTSLPPPFDHSQVPISGSEFMDCAITFSNTNTTPLRIPALDGQTNNDWGFVSAPILNYTNEISLLNQEISALIGFGSATVDFGGLTLHITIAPSSIIGVGDTVTFLSGANTGQISKVSAIISYAAGVYTVTVSTAFTNSDFIGSDVLVRQINQPSLRNILSQEILLMQTAIASPSASGASIGTLQNEISSAVSIMKSFGSILVSGSSGSTNSITLVDGGVDFITANIQPGHLLVVPSGPNIGLYKIATISDSHTLTINPTAPFLTSFSAVTPGVSYSILSPWNFLSSKEYEFPNNFISKTLNFANQTATWLSSFSPAGVIARRNQIFARQVDITAFIKQISGLLGKDDRIYDTRFLWISRRIDKKSGTLTRQSQAASRRVEATTRLLQDQQLLMIANQLM